MSYQQVKNFSKFEKKSNLALIFQNGRSYEIKRLFSFAIQPYRPCRRDHRIYKKQQFDFYAFRQYFLRASFNIQPSDHQREKVRRKICSLLYTGIGCLFYLSLCDASKTYAGGHDAHF